MTQAEMILDYLKHNANLSCQEARMMFGCDRLPARINDLKRRGNDIRKFMDSAEGMFGKRKHFARYWLNKAKGDQHERTADD